MTEEADILQCVLLMKQALARDEVEAEVDRFRRMRVGAKLLELRCVVLYYHEGCSTNVFRI